MGDTPTYHRQSGMPAWCANLKNFGKRPWPAPSLGPQTLGAGPACRQQPHLCHSIRDLRPAEPKVFTAWPFTGTGCRHGDSCCCHKARTCSEVPEAALRVKGPPTQAWDARDIKMTATAISSNRRDSKNPRILIGTQMRKVTKEHTRKVL